MLEELRKKIRKKILFRILFGVIAIVIIAAIFLPSTIKLIKGPEMLDDIPLDSLENKYVAGDIYAVYDSFYYYTESSSGKQDIDIVYYTIPIGETEFCTIAYDNYCTKADTLYEDTYAYFNQEIDEITSTFSVKGTFKKMDKETYDYYIKFFIDSGFSDEQIDSLALPYILKVDQIGSFDIAYIKLAYGGIAIALLFILINIILIITDRGLSQIKKTLASDMSANAEYKMERDYERALAIENLKVGELYTYFIQNGKAYAINNNDIVWCYLKKVTNYVNGIKTGVSKALMIYTNNKKNYCIGMSKEDNIILALDHYSQNHPNIVLGYTDKLKKMFKKDFDSFRLLAQHQIEEFNNNINANNDNSNTINDNTNTANDNFDSVNDYSSTANDNFDDTKDNSSTTNDNIDDIYKSNEDNYFSK